MDKFVNITDPGNEKAIKRGSRVPDGAVNISWAKSPRLTPEQNIVIVDTSRSTEENAINDQYSCRIMYADALGVLQDAYGNQIVADEFPAIADVFSIDEDFVTTPGSEYKAEHILGFVHVSRYFHVDFPGLTLGTTPQTYNDEVLKVVDDNGRDYVDDNGNPKYRIQITPAYVSAEETDESSAYRVFAFVDTDLNENLYLTYNKVEVSATGRITNQNINYREILNPQRYFQYKPEESDVVDLHNRHRKWYSTKPVTLKQQILNMSSNDADGYKVYVPKKAIGDPRLFQLFRWRVACDFTERYTIDPTKDSAAIRAGVVVTNGATTMSPYIFYNTENNQWNVSGVPFINPLKDASADKKLRAYWEVNFDTISYEDLKKFDVLVWAPLALTFDFTQYLNKINYFTNTLGRTLIIETGNYLQPTGLGITVSHPTYPNTGGASYPGPGTYVEGTTIRPTTAGYLSPLLDGDTQLGGWELNDGTPDELASLTNYNNGAFNGTKAQYIISSPSDWSPIYVGTDSVGTTRSIFLHKTTAGGGNVLFSTVNMGAAVGYLFSNISGLFVHANRGTTVLNDPNYRNFINSYSMEGTAKVFYNMMLLAVKGAILDSSDERRFSTSWSFYSPWKASWVINADVLSEEERDKNDFVFLPKDPTILEPVWQRKLTNKTVKQLVDEQLSAADARRVAGATRTYRLEITNDLVEGPTTIDDNTKPYAWTEAYSPPFTVPVELGPHVIREEPVQGEYDAAQYSHKSYPPKPYRLQVGANYNSSSESLISEITTITATGYATAVTTSVTPIRTVNTDLAWTSHGSNVRFNSSQLFEYGQPQAFGISTWQQQNYYTNAWGPGNRIWPHYGIFGRYAQGSSGDVVAFLQEAMNRFLFFGVFGSSTGYLSVDGYYGSRTATCIRAFQSTLHARYVDGVVDAETLSMVGNQILRLRPFMSANPNDYTRYFAWPTDNIDTGNISDHNSYSRYMKRSWISGGPSIIWELFAVTFNQPYSIHGVSVTPAVEGATNSVMWRSIHIAHLGDSFQTHNVLRDYNSQWGQAIYMPHRPVDGQRFYIPIGPYYGDTVIIGIGQDGGSGAGSSRVLGVRDIVAHAITQTGGETITVRNTVPLSYSFGTRVVTGKDIVVALNPQYKGQGYLENVRWTNVTSSNPEVYAFLNTNNNSVLLRHNQVNVNLGNGFTFGPTLPATGTQLYSINENSKANPQPESGWITKTDGIKLLSDRDGKPVGFPSFPTDIGANEAQRHYGTLSISNLGKDPSVLVGFYDFAQKEFIFNEVGEPEMTFIEYMRRGPQNVYVGLISTYEVETKRDIPVSNDAPVIPFRWAMPVYGLCQRGGSRIGIEPLPKGLGPTDIWPVPIRTGKFNKVHRVRRLRNGPLSGWLRNYQGTQIKAFYSVPEADLGGWSTIYGRPNTDVVDETPFILDDSVIQVAQAPILMVQEPTALPAFADPVHPVFKVSVKDSVASEWRDLGMEDILDFNVSDGTIYLREPLTDIDPNFVRVSYTTNRRVYPFKQYDGQILNLNPYPGHNRDMIGKPIYVYIVPEYAKDFNGRVITGSLEERTVRFTLTTNIFDPLDPEYNPLAVQLGVVYITTALDIDDLIMLDTRRRGGGVSDTRTKEEIVRIVQEAIGYWDIGFGAGMTYQNGGYIIVRLPEELKVQFPNAKDIEKVIQSNITAGVAFKIEDLNGGEWS